MSDSDPDFLSVVPELILHAWTVGRAHHEDLAANYAATLWQACDAEGGWIGRSGLALSALLDRWQSDAADHHGLLNDHHDGLGAAASQFVEMDRVFARRLGFRDDAHAG